MTTKDIARFWSKVNFDGPVHPGLGTKCWDYTGARFSSRLPGAFRLTVAPGVYRQVLASRVAFEIQHGPLGKLYACHKCDRPICVRGDHLFAGTAKDNEQDKIAKGRIDYRKGNSSHYHRLTEAKVLELRAMRATGMTYKKMSLATGIPFGTIAAVIQRRNWGHI